MQRIRTIWNKEKISEKNNFTYKMCHKNYIFDKRMYRKTKSAEWIWKIKTNWSRCRRNRWNSKFNFLKKMYNELHLW